jgi:hypothetical protein
MHRATPRSSGRATAIGWPTLRSLTKAGRPAWAVTLKDRLATLDAARCSAGRRPGHRTGRRIRPRRGRRRRGRSRIYRTRPSLRHDYSPRGCCWPCCALRRLTGSLSKIRLNSRSCGCQRRVGCNRCGLRNHRWRCDYVRLRTDLRSWSRRLHRWGRFSHNRSYGSKPRFN